VLPGGAAWAAGRFSSGISSRVPSHCSRACRSACDQSLGCCHRGVPLAITAWPQDGERCGEQPLVRHQMDGVGDGHRGQRMLAEQGAQRGQVTIPAEYPGHVDQALSRRGLSCQGEHRRFGIRPRDSMDAACQRNRQPPGAAADIGDHVAGVQPQCLRQRFDEGGRVPASVPRRERGDLAAELSCHLPSMTCAPAPASEVQPTAWRWPSLAVARYATPRWAGAPAPSPGSGESRGLLDLRVPDGRGGAAG
jgi:hypothetical protein